MRDVKRFCTGKSLRTLWGWLAAAFLITHFSCLMSCSSIDCPVQNTVATYYSLLKADGTPDTLIGDTLWIWTPRANGTGASRDYTLDKNDTLLNSLYGAGSSSFSLPISYTMPEDTLCLLLVDSLGREYSDTILLKKENHPHFESVDCQAAYFHTLTGVRCTHRAIDSVVINHPSVTYDDTQTHLLLYLKARY